MSESEPSDEQAAGQHYLVCGSEDCQENGQVYCNVCHLPLCEQCRDEHLKSSKTNTHEIVLYRHRKHQLPELKCELHPIRNVDMFCKECKIPLCSKCSTSKEHHGHKFDDLEEIYTERYAIWQSEFSKIQKYFLPTTQGLKKDIEKDATTIKNTMENIRTSMKTQAESLKNKVDEITLENIQHANEMENSLLEMLESQKTTYDEYIAYLEKMTDEFQEYLSLTNQKLLFLETLKIQSIPETTQILAPIFSAVKFNKNGVAKLLGRISFPKIKPEVRNIQPLEEESSHMKSTEKQLEQSKEKSDMQKQMLSLSSSVTKVREHSVPGVDRASHVAVKKSYMKQTLSLSPSVSKVREYSVPSVDRACHVSVEKSGRLWVSDHKGHLVQTDHKGTLLQMIQTSSEWDGYHTATQDGDLIYTDRDKNLILSITPDRKITEFIKTGEWTPLSIHSSHINGDLLLGMIKDEEAKVTRYSKAGKEIQNIQKDNQGQGLYGYPHYITENINGDICTSDYNKDAVVVVNKSGQHRFSYTGNGSVFHPWGICTDVLGHILVCDEVSRAVHMLDQDGGFCSFIYVYSQQYWLRSIMSSLLNLVGPRGVCVDDEGNLYVGQCDTTTVKVYKYLQ